MKDPTSAASHHFAPIARRGEPPSKFWRFWHFLAPPRCSRGALWKGLGMEYHGVLSMAFMRDQRVRGIHIRDACFRTAPGIHACAAAAVGQWRRPFRRLLEGEEVCTVIFRKPQPRLQLLGEGRQAHWERIRPLLQRTRLRGAGIGDACQRARGVRKRWSGLGFKLHSNNPFQRFERQEPVDESLQSLRHCATRSSVSTSCRIKAKWSPPTALASHLLQDVEGSRFWSFQGAGHGVVVLSLACHSLSLSFC